MLHVGRGVAADLHLNDISVSHRHAIIVPSPARVQDGTFVEGRRIEHNQLRSGDVITIGRLELRYMRPIQRTAARADAERPASRHHTRVPGRAAGRCAVRSA